MRIPSGKIGVALCGHRGEHLTTNYVQCLEGCEVSGDEAPEVEFCPKCFKNNIDTEFELDAIYFMWNPSALKVDRRCWDCGALWSKS